MDESFKLLSSMSPKLTMSGRKKIRAPTKLALRKPIRKSMIFDKLPPTIRPTKVAISTETESCSETSTTTNTNWDCPAKTNDFLSESKYEAIESWVAQTAEVEAANESIFSQISIIQSDKTRIETGVANSTRIDGGADVAFDNLFYKREIDKIDAFQKKLVFATKEKSVNPQEVCRLFESNCTPLNPSVLSKKKPMKTVSATVITNIDDLFKATGSDWDFVKPSGGSSNSKKAQIHVDDIKSNFKGAEIDYIDYNSPLRAKVKQTGDNKDVPVFKGWNDMEKKNDKNIEKIKQNKKDMTNKKENQYEGKEKRNDNEQSRKETVSSSKAFNMGYNDYNSSLRVKVKTSGDNEDVPDSKGWRNEIEKVDDKYLEKIKEKRIEIEMETKSREKGRKEKRKENETGTDKKNMKELKKIIENETTRGAEKLIEKQKDKVRRDQENEVMRRDKEKHKEKVRRDKEKNTLRKLIQNSVASSQIENGNTIQLVPENINSNVLPAKTFPRNCGDVSDKVSPSMKNKSKPIYSAENGNKTTNSTEKKKPKRVTPQKDSFNKITTGDFKTPSPLEFNKKVQQPMGAKVHDQDSSNKNPLLSGLMDTCEPGVVEDDKENHAENVQSIGMQTPEKRNEPELADYEKLLDELYGMEWRSNREAVLNTEPRPTKKTKPIILTEHPKTERKPKISMTHKNPYLEREQNKSKKLTSILNAARMKATLESPWSNRLQSLCDPESDENSAAENIKAKLNFDDADSPFRKPQRVRSSSSSSSEDKMNSDGSSSGTRHLVDKILGKARKQSVSSWEDASSTSESAEKKSSDDCFVNTDHLEDRIRKKQITKVKTNVKTEKKKHINPKKPIYEIDSDSSTSSDNYIVQPIKPKPPINTTQSFLASLSAAVPLSQCDASARIFRNCYKNYREELLQKLFKLFNEKIFDNALPADSGFEWSDRLRGTAAYCSCKKITRRTGAVERTARFVLSTKVLDSADRLRDTLVHEMCHAVTWVVNHVTDGHGRHWKAWAAKAMRTFPELPPIKRCHDYAITTKYTYKCTQCGYSFGRHSKSLDLERKRCGHCHGKFEVLLNKKTADGNTKSVPATPKKEPTGFALFVKENYAVFKQPDRKHGDVMKLLGQQFRELKVTK